MAAVLVGAAIGQAVRGTQALSATDAVVFQAAGRIIAAHGCVYCTGAERSAQLALLGGHLQPNGVEAFNNPPLMAWLVQPVAGLSLSAYTALSVLIEAAALLVGLFMAQRLLIGSVELRAPLLVVAIALVAPLPGLETLVFAQWVGLMLVALLGAYLLARSNHGFAAGLALSLLLVKPQDIWLVPIVLIAARAWPMLLGLAAGAGAWLLTSVAVVSFGTLAHLPSVLGQNQSQIQFTDGLPGIAAAIAGSGWGIDVAVLGIALACAAFPFRSRLRRDPLLALDIGIVLSLLFSPHVFSADLLLMGAVLVDVGRRNLAAGVAGAVDARRGIPARWVRVPHHGSCPGHRAVVHDGDRRRRCSATAAAGLACIGRARAVLGTARRDGSRLAMVAAEGALSHGRLRGSVRSAGD